MKITDVEILELIKKGLIWASGTRIYKFHNGRKRFHCLSPNSHPLSGRIRYNIRIKQRQRTIYANRLLWMIENKRLVPDRADIDHVDNNRLNDSVENLKPRDARCNRREGFGIQMEKNLQSWNDLLDFIQFMGYPPPDGHPLWS